jgi:nucleoid DNA-binding protein
MAVKSISKTEVLNSLAEATSLSKKEVALVMDELAALIGSQIGKKGPGVFTIPGLMKITRKEIAKKAARKNVWVPLVQEYRDIPAKPARTTVKVTPLKKLKDMV